MMVWKIFLFQGSILRFHLNLPGCTVFNGRNDFGVSPNLGETCHSTKNPNWVWKKGISMRTFLVRRCWHVFNISAFDHIPYLFKTKLSTFYTPNLWPAPNASSLSPHNSNRPAGANKRLVEVNMYHICQHFILPLTMDNACSYVELVANDLQVPGA